MRRSPPFDNVFLILLTVLLGLWVLLPLLVVLIGAFGNVAGWGRASEQWVGHGGPWVWFRYVAKLYGGTLLFSLKLALSAVGVSLFVGVPAGYALVRHPFPGSRFIEALILLPLSIPGIALALGLIHTYGAFRDRGIVILAGHILYTLPFMVRTVTNTLRSFDIARLELAARSLGAGFIRRLLHVVLPSLRHAMVVGALLVFAISWGEFNVSFLLNTPLHQTYPAALYATYTSNSFQVSSAATVLFLAVIVPVLMLVQWLGGRELSRVEQGA